MKLISFATAMAVTTVLSTAMAAAPLETLDQRLSYIMGGNLAAQFKRDDVKFDFDAFKLSFDEIINDKERSLSEAEMRKAVADIQQRTAKIKAEKAKKISEENIKAGKAYLEENAKKEGVVVTASGLQYKEVTAGNGEKPKSTDRELCMI